MNGWGGFWIGYELVACAFAGLFASQPDPRTPEEKAAQVYAVGAWPLFVYAVLKAQGEVGG